MKQISQAEYHRLLGDRSPGADKDSRLAQALDTVIATRQFEIEMYWKRSTYFWTLVTVNFAGYFTVQAVKIEAGQFFEKRFYAFVIALIGFVFALAWCLANKGSKYWHENWENHAGLLGEGVMGPLFNITLERPAPKGFRARALRVLLEPDRYSVSKLNAATSWFVVAVWGTLLALNLPRWGALPSWINRYTVLVVIGVSFASLLFLSKSSEESDYEHIAMKREVGIRDPET